MDAKLTRRVAPAVLCLAVMWVPAGTAVVTDRLAPQEQDPAEQPQQQVNAANPAPLFPKREFSSRVRHESANEADPQRATPNLLDVEWYGSGGY